MTASTAFMHTMHAAFTDRAVIVIMILAVLIYGLYYPEAYRHQSVDRLPAVVVDLDDSASSRGLARKLQALQGITIEASLGSLAEAEAWVGAGQADAVLLIAPGFERNILRGNQGHVVMYGNGSNLLRASSALVALGDGIAAYAIDAAREQARFAGRPTPPTLALVQRPLYNTRLGYGSTVVPAVGQLIAQQTLLIGMALVLATRRQQLGRRLRMTAPALFGVMSFFVIIGMFSSAYFAGFVPWLQDYPRGGNALAMLLAIPVYAVAVVAFGLFLGSFFRVRERAMLFLLPVALPMYFFSGVSWPMEAMPVPATWLAWLMPSTHGITLMMKLNQMGARLHEVGPELIGLAALTTLYGGLAWWRYRPMAGT